MRQMTKVWPIARIAIIDPWRSRFEMLLAVAKVGVAKARKTQSATRRPSSVSAKRKPKLRRGFFMAATASALEL